MLLAPRLPPETSTVSFAASKPNVSSAFSRLAVMTSRRMGFPVKTAFLRGKRHRASSVPTAIFVTNFDKILFVTPGTTFCS